MDVSVVVPVYNEVDNVSLLHEALAEVLAATNYSYEIIFVNDGSSDSTGEALDALAEEHPHLVVIHLRRNYGQTAALDAGIQHARGEAIVTMDGDLQNDPADIPRMLEKFHEGYDLVHGWRKQRRDAYWNRKLPSKIANWIISKVTRLPVHDLGCALKVIRRNVAQELQLQGDMHRFIAVLAFARGARCCEMVTNHRARQFGTSKYGLSRIVRVMLDLVTVKYLLDYAAKPMRLFGMLGLGCGAVGTLAGIATVGLKITTNFDMTGNPLLLLTTFAWILGIQFFTLGLLAEISARIYFQAQNLRNYAIRSIKESHSTGLYEEQTAKAA